MPNSLWRERLLDLLRRLYELLGGNPTELVSLDEAIVQVQERFGLYGLPGLSPTEKNSGLAALDELKDMLADPDNDLSTSLNTTLTVFRVDLSNAIASIP